VRAEGPSITTVAVCNVQFITHSSHSALVHNFFISLNVNHLIHSSKLVEVRNSKNKILNFNPKHSMVYRRSYRRYSPRRYTRRRPSYTPVVRPRRRAVRRRRTPTRRPTKMANSPVEFTPSLKFALAQLDPFDPRCMGAKIPDSNTMPSLANSDVDILASPAPSVAGNFVCLAFRPAYTMATVTAVQGAGGVTWSGSFGGTANRSKRTAYTDAIEVTRPVSHAIRISSSLAPTSATGFVHIGLAVETRYGETTWTFPTTIEQMGGLAHYKRVTIASLTQSPLTVINKWIDDTAFRYSSPLGAAGQQTNESFQNDYGWSTVIVMIEGAPITSPPLSFEHILHSEGLPKKEGVFVGSTAAPNSPGIMSAVSSMQTETDFAHTEAEQDSYISQGASAFARGAAQAGSNVYNNVAIPLLERIGGAAMNAAMSAAAGALRGGIPGVNANPNRLALM